MTGWIEIVSVLLNLVLVPSLIIAVATLRSTRKKAAADAEKAEAETKKSELENVESAISIWRQLAEEMEGRQRELSRQVDVLSTEVKRLKNATNRVARLLDKITAENMAETVQQIRDEIRDEIREGNVDGCSGDHDGLPCTGNDHPTAR